MQEALQLIKEYKKSKEVQEPNFVEQLDPALQKLFALLNEIAAKETPVPVIKNEIAPSEVKVELANPIEVFVPETKFPDIKFPKSSDYTNFLSELKKSVDKLEATLSGRPKAWSVVRNKNGFIEEVVAKD
jgi:hypothetical protein